MRELQFYLSNARDYLEGTGAVKRVTAYYNSHKVHAEMLWSDLFYTKSKPEEFDRFCELLEKDGLFIQVEDRHSEKERKEKHDVRFDIRVYDGGQVAVLKVSYLPDTAF